MVSAFLSNNKLPCLAAPMESRWDRAACSRHAVHVAEFLLADFPTEHQEKIRYLPAAVDIISMPSLSCRSRFKPSS